jgi:hypothetical protein
VKNNEQFSYHYCIFSPPFPSLLFSVPLGLAISLYVFVAIMLSVGYAIITAGTYCMYCMCNTCMYCTCVQYVCTKQNDSTSSQPHSFLPPPTLPRTDVQRLVLAPIERMMNMVDEVSRNPLQKLQFDHENNSGGECVHCVCGGDGVV